MADGLIMNFRNSGAIAKARDLRGRFVSIQVEVKSAHEAMAIELQKLQVEELRKRVELTARPQRPGHALEQAILSEENREVTIDGFTVGGYLPESAAAPYYRHIEEGYSGFVGRTFYGFFVSAAGLRSAPSPERYRRDVELIQTSSPIHTKKGNQHISKTSVRSDVSSDSQLSGATGHMVTIHNPIPDYHYLVKGMEQWEASGIETREYRKALRAFKGLVKFTTAKGNVGAIRK